MDGCTSCDGRCCARYHVTLTHSEVRRITHCGHDPLEYLAWLPVGSVKTNHPDIRLGTTYHYMALKRHADGRCVFAQVVDAGLRCSIHGIHPNSCSMYPMDPHRAMMRLRPICAVEWTFDKSKEQLNIEDMRARMEYSEIAQMWNSRKRKKRSARDFLKFAGIVDMG